MFDIRIVNLDVVSDLCMKTKKALAKAEKDNKNLYLQACLERRRSFTPIVYSADRIPGAESLDSHKRLAALRSFKIKLQYSELYGFVRERMSLAIVRSSSLLLCGPGYKE